MFAAHFRCAWRKTASLLVAGGVAPGGSRCAHWPAYKRCLALPNYHPCKLHSVNRISTGMCPRLAYSVDAKRRCTRKLCSHNEHVRKSLVRTSKPGILDSRRTEPSMRLCQCLTRSPRRWLSQSAQLLALVLVTQDTVDAGIIREVPCDLQNCCRDPYLPPYRCCGG